MNCHFQSAGGADLDTLHETLLAHAGMHAGARVEPTRWSLDTFDQRLAAAGFVLEADQLDGGRYRVNLRARKGEGAEQVVCGPGLPRFATDCLRPRLRARLAKLTGGRALLATCLGVLHVRHYEYLDARGKIMARLALEVPAGAATPPVLRISALSGFEIQAQSLSRKLGRGRSLRPLQQDCAEFHLAGRGLNPPSFEAKPVVRLRANLGAGRALARLLEAYTQTLRTTEGGIITDCDREFLHDYRVTLRSIRSWLGDLRSVVDGPTRLRFRGELSELNRATGALRDLDVLGEKLDGYLAACGAASAESEPLLRARIAATREDARRALVAHLGSASYLSAMDSWSTFLGELANGRLLGRRGRQPVRNVVTRALQHRLTAILDFDPEHARRDPQVLHEFRKHCKKLRYLLEGFQTLFEPSALRAAIQELKVLQAAMGDTWDIFVHHGLLQALAQDLATQEHGAVGAQVLIETLETRLSALEQAHVVLVNRAFMRFRGARVQRLYARLQEIPP